MKIETALQKPRSVQQLMKLTGLSRGGVLGGLKRLKAKKAGEKRQGQRGPASTLYALRGTPTVKSAKRARRTVAAAESYPTAEITPEQIAASTVGAAAPEFIHDDTNTPVVAAEPTAEVSSVVETLA